MGVILKAIGKHLNQTYLTIEMSLPFMLKYLQLTDHRVVINVIYFNPFLVLIGQIAVQPLVEPTQHRMHYVQL